ncbi:MAG: DNA gyrase subunit A [Candidatus Aureabacteria bacterium]|nr:DNA gyrase subunit A [Candidatus Auribacterota bacterium]
MYTENEKIISRSISLEMKNSYLDYSMSVIVGRALPDVRDGLKPVHRRILFAMKDLGITHRSAYKKSARIVGEVLGKYHPHGDTAVYDTMVRMVQDFSLRYPLIDGQGNFGSIDGDAAAAMRYTEVKMERIAEELLEDIDKETVDFSPNFDESLLEPTILPSKIPNLLINGSSGIAVGMATNIPSHNLSEIIDGTIHLINNPEATIKELCKFVKGPDFPTAAIICGKAPIKSMYETGYGKLKLKARAGIEPLKGGKESIVITEIPYNVNKSNLIEDIARLVNNKKITGISDIRDESDKDGMRIVIELKRGEISRVILNQLYKHTQMETTFGAILLALDKNRPRVMNLKEIMECYIEHRKEVVIRRTKFELRKAEERAHILEGFKIALDHIDEFVKIIKKSKDRDEARKTLISKFKLSDIQANAILELRLYQLTGLEREKIDSEYKELIKRIAYLKNVLSSERMVLNIIAQELKEIKDRYGDNRRTEIVAEEGEVSIEDMIANEGCIITISHTGYIKRCRVATYRQQRRGGKGVTGMEMKDEDFIERVFTASTHDYILFFTSMGKCYWKKVYDIPEGGRLSKGKAMVNLLDIRGGENVAALIRVSKFEEGSHLMMITEKGIVKKTSLAAFSNPRKGGIIAIKIDEGDTLKSVNMTEANDEFIVVTRNGISIRFKESDIRSMGRATRGVKGISLRKEDIVVTAEVVGRDKTILIVCEKGYGKRSEFDEYRLQKRGGKGIIAIKAGDRNGKVVGVLVVVDDDEIMLITKGGKMVRTPVKGIRITGRNTQGVRVINLSSGDLLVGVSKIITPKNEEEIEKQAEIEEERRKGERRSGEDRRISEKQYTKKERRTGEERRSGKDRRENPAK